MTKKWFSGRKIRGLSTDSKPTNPETDAEFYETNTKKTFDYTGGAWVERTSGLSATDDITVESKTQSLSDWIIMQKVVPAVATNVVATPDGDTTVTVSYDVLDTDKVSAVRVQNSPTPYSTWTTATTTANDTSYQVTGLTPDTDYKFRIYPSNIMGEQSTTTYSDSGDASTTWLIPSTPTGLTLENQRPDIALSWSAPAGFPTITYTIEHSLTGSGSWNVVNTTTALSTSDNNVTLDVPHYYRVRATNSVGSSGNSAVSNMTVITPSISVTGSPVYSTSGVYSYYKWTGAGTVTMSGYRISTLLVGGGGGGGAGAHYGAGGGGGGGVVLSTAPYIPTSTSSMNIVVGSAGSGGGSLGGTGGTSSFDIYEAGGGGGGSSGSTGGIGGSTGGGAGGGGSSNAGGGGGSGGGSSTAGNITHSAFAGSSSGAGAGAMSVSNNGGNGEYISLFSQFGQSGYFGGGGGRSVHSGTTSSGGLGGGATGRNDNGGSGGATGASGSGGMGGGGGAGGWLSSGGNGGVGVVLIRYVT